MAKKQKPKKPKNVTPDMPKPGKGGAAGGPMIVRIKHPKPRVVTNF